MTANRKLLLTDIELLNEGAVLVHVLLCEIIEQAATLADHLEQPAAAMVVLRIFLEVRSERVDVGGEDRDLYFRAPGVVRCFAKFRGKLTGRLFRNWHWSVG